MMFKKLMDIFTSNRAGKMKSKIESILIPNIRLQNLTRKYCYPNTYRGTTELTEWKHQ